MTYIQALILSVVEGISEFLPISSTGHLILTSNILQIPQTEFVKSFEIIIQLGAIFAIPVLYAQTLVKNIKVWKKIIIAFIPTGILGLILYKHIKNLLLGNSTVTVITLFIGGILMIVLEKVYKEKPHHLDDISKLSTSKAVAVGFFQSISMIPGISRAAASIFGGMFMGMKRKTAVEFSFLLAIPTMTAAAGLDLVKSSWSFTSGEFFLLVVGFIGAFVTALITVRAFIRFIEHSTFTPFGIYRIMAALAFWFFVR